MSLDPTVQVAVVGLVGTLLTLVAEGLRRQHKAITETRNDARMAREQVQNSHTTNLRDDMDQMHEDVRRVLAMVVQHGSEIGGLRADLRMERDERLTVAKRLDVLSASCPLLNGEHLTT